MSDLEETLEGALARVIHRQARNIECLTAEVERLRGVVEAAEGAVDDWDNRPALDRLNTSAFMRLRGALAALEAGDG